MRRAARPALIVPLLIGLLIGGPASARDEELNARIFDKAWMLVADRYWDRTMGGNDWEAIRDRYEPQALAAANEKQLYAVINRMLDQLDDSHVYATSPSAIAWSKEPVAEDGEMPPGRRAVMIDDRLLLIAFNQFEAGDDKWIRRSIDAHPDLRGVILDLRDNGGGRDDVLDKVAGLFTTRKQLLIRLNGRRDIEETTLGAGPHAYQGPLAVIVGPNTASAAEILAFFLGENGRAETVGERTAGSVTGGVDHRLPGGGRLTVAEYDIRTANGTRLEGNGFTPRHRTSTARKPNDAALAKAVALLNGQSRSH